MNKKLIIIMLIILIIWASVFYLFINYAQELREHPCQVCADKMGEEITCTSIAYTYPPIQQTFIPET